MQAPSSPTADARGRLLAAAAGRFARDGYAAASVRDVCADAGVTPPVLYWHFESKEGIYVAVLEEAVREHRSAVASAAARGGAASARIVRVLEAAADLAGRNRDLLLLVQAAIFGHPRGAPAFDLASPRKRFRETLMRLVREGIEAGEFRRGSVPDTTDVLLGIHDVQMRAIRAGATPRAARGRIRRLARVVFEGLNRRHGGKP